MSDPLFDGDDDANTPFEPEERDGLIPSYITLRRELNEAEQVNIDKAIAGRSTRVSPRSAYRGFHLRTAQAHVRRCVALGRGVPHDPAQYRRRSVEDRADLRALSTTRILDRPPDLSTRGIAVRFHHRLVAIHPFPTAMAAVPGSPPTCSHRNWAGTASPGAAPIWSTSLKRGAPMWRRSRPQIAAILGL